MNHKLGKLDIVWLVIVLVAILCSVASFRVYAYEPLTRAEADNYLTSIKYEEILDIVIDYDYIEHSEIEVTYPDVTYLLVGDDLVITPNGKTEVGVANFLWEVDAQQEVLYNFYGAPDSNYKVWIGLAIGVTTGVAVGYMIGNVVGGIQ